MQTQRSYQARLRPTPDQVELLERNFDVYHAGAREALDVLLNFGALVRPEHDISENRVQGKKKKDVDLEIGRAHV